MNLTLYRDSKGQDSTIGRLCIGDGVSEVLFCYTCEDEKRINKVAGKTRIPAGIYEIKLRTGSPMANRYDNKFHRIGHDGMIHLQDVPDFTNVYLHIGNTHEDTEGCLLVGYSCTIDTYSGGGSIGRSTQAYEKLYPMVYEAIKSGEKVFITIKDEGIK